MTTISVVTSMYNRKMSVLQTIHKMFLPSLARNGDSQMELIIVDDGSPLAYETEGLIKSHEASLKRAFSNVTFVRNETNLGVAGSFNRGLQMASGEKVVIVNDDIYFPKHSIERLAHTLDEPGDYLIAGPITNSPGVGSFQYAKQAPTLKSYAKSEFERLENFSTWLYERMKGVRITIAQTMNHLCGFCFVADTAFLKEIGMYDESFRYGFYEDTDMIQRIARVYGPQKIVFNCEVFVGHGGIKGFSQSMLQHPIKGRWAPIANGFRFRRRWGYVALFRVISNIVKCQFGKDTISELLPKKIEI